VVVVEESGGGSVAGVAAIVVEVVPVVSARAGAAGTQATATNTPVMAKPRRIRLDNTGILSPGVRGCPPECDSDSNGNAVEHIGPYRPFVTKGNVPER
jgi:orotidine-5'-phosphate decarboxylase